VVGFSIRLGRRLSWLNVLFALLYLLGDGAIENAHPGIFSDVFFFNVETNQQRSGAHRRTWRVRLPRQSPDIRKIGPRAIDQRLVKMEGDFNQRSAKIGSDPKLLASAPATLQHRGRHPDHEGHANRRHKDSRMLFGERQCNPPGCLRLHIGLKTRKAWSKARSGGTATR
jgi:hypothetical protein